MQSIIITSAIIALDQTPAEKILLAHLCQRSTLANGSCTDSNKELAEATGLHLRTIPDLVKRLTQVSCLYASIDQSKANRRTIRPSEELLKDYTQMDSRHLEGYTQLANSMEGAYTPLSSSTQKDYTLTTSSRLESQESSSQSIRLCPVTGVDITHQPSGHRVANQATLFALSQQAPAHFAQLVKKLLSPQEAQLPLSGQCIQINLNARRMSRQPTAVESAPVVQPRAVKRKQRLCPISGVEISRQRADVLYVAKQTLERMARKQPDEFRLIVERFFPQPEIKMSDAGYYSIWIAKIVRQQAAQLTR